MKNKKIIDIVDLLHLEIDCRLMVINQSEPRHEENDLEKKIKNFYDLYSRFKLTKSVPEHCKKIGKEIVSEIEDVLLSNKIFGGIPNCSELDIDAKRKKIDQLEEFIIHHLYDVIIKDLETFESNSKNGKVNDDDIRGLDGNQIIYDSFVKMQKEGDENKPSEAPFLRFLVNKKKRYEIRRRKFNIEIKPDTIQSAIREQLKNILRKSSTKDDIVNEAVTQFRQFINYLLLKYKIKYAIVEIERSKSIVEDNYLENYVKSDNILDRCINIFTFTKVVAKHFPYIWLDSDPSLEDKKNVKLVGCPLYKRNDKENAVLKDDDVEHFGISFLVEILSFLMRSFIFSLLGKNKRSFNDYTEIEIIFEKISPEIKSKLKNLCPPQDKNLSRIARVAKLVVDFSNTHKPMVLFRKGELYRKDYSYVNAFFYFCECEEFFKNFIGEEKNSIKGEVKNSGLRLLNSISKGKTFFEIGELKKSLKWFLQALDYSFKTFYPEEKEEGKTILKGYVVELSQSVSSLLVDKSMVNRIFKNIYDDILIAKVKDSDKLENSSFIYLISDITNRIGAILFTFNIPDDETKEKHTLALKYVKFSLCINDTNLLANINNKLLANEINSGRKEGEDKTFKQLSLDGTIFEKWTRLYSYMVVKSLQGLNNQSSEMSTDEDKRKKNISTKLLRKFFTYTDNLISKSSQVYKYLMSKRIIPEIGDKKGNIKFISLRKWSSFSPFLPRPSSFSIRGGGYFLIYKGFGIAIDPGQGFLENLLGEGYSISDIDAVLVTHDHPDHIADLDGIITLFDYTNRMMKSERDKNNEKRLYLLFNLSASNKYSSLQNENNYNVIPLIANSRVCMQEYDERINLEIDVIKTHHGDIGYKNNSVGIIFNFGGTGKPKKQFDTEESAPCRKIGYTSDTSIIPNISDISFWRSFKREYKHEICKIFKNHVKNHDFLKKIEDKIENKYNYLKFDLDIFLEPDEKKSIKKIREFCGFKDSDISDIYLKRLRRAFYNLIIEKTFKTFYKFLECDVLVLHISCVPFAELRYLDKMNFTDDNAVEAGNMLKKVLCGLNDQPYKEDNSKSGDRQNNEFDETLERIRAEIKGETSEKFRLISQQIGFAHWYKKDIYDICKEKPPIFHKTQHLYLTGILDFMEKIKTKKDNEKKDNSKCRDLLIVLSEFREEMGSYRNKIAEFINEEFFKDDKNINIFTADIGLNIKLNDKTAKDSEDSIISVACTTCSKFNDYTENDIYHSPENLKEVCVKREEEGMVYNCKRHDPGFPYKMVAPKFIEKIERYDVFKNRYMR